MDRTEAAAACHLTGDVLAEVTTLVEGVHRGILSRVRTCLTADRRRSVTMDAIELPTAAVYSVVRGATLGLGAASASATSALMLERPRLRQSVHTTPRGAAVMAGLNCALGDQMADEERVRPLAPEMAFRVEGKPVSPARILDDLDVERTGTVAVFLHGLGGTEFQWSPLYEAALRADGVSSVFVRYNSGLPMHANGAALVDLVSKLFADPRSGLIRRVILIGHSMGGLIARSALSQAAEAHWLPRISDLVSLGSPHHGAAGEKVAAVALAGLRRARESKAIADFGNQRAAGIKDLRHGALLAHHWGGHHADDVLFDTTEDVPLPAHVRHHAVVATLGRPGGVLGKVLGDGLVRTKSASGRGDDMHRQSMLRLYETGHMTLLRHPQVAGLICDVSRAEPISVG